MMRSDPHPHSDPQQLAVALPHPLHGGFHGSLGHRELVAELRVRLPARFARLIILEPLEQSGLAARHVFLAQAIQRRLHDRLCPAPFENLIRRQLIDRSSK